MLDAARPDQPSAAAPSIGIFDSGLGGLSVLRAVRRSLPAVPMQYVADSAFAPYGERSTDEICQRTLLIARRLINDGAKMLVVACNTATAAAIAALRERWPELAIVGVEPGIKPGLRVSHSGRIAVMATEATLRSARFRALLEREQAAAERLLQRQITVHLQACPGLAAAIETTDLHGAELHATVGRCCEPLHEVGVDTVVLGCTHYPFVAPQIRTALGDGITLVDTAEAVARQAALRWATDVAGHRDTAVAVPANAAVRYRSSGDPQRLRHAVIEWLGELQPEVGSFVEGEGD